MLIEIIFKGLFSVLNPAFLSKLVINAKEARFNSIESSYTENFENMFNNFRENDYVDFVITTDDFIVDGTVIPKVFINMTKDEDNFEILIYFDLHDFIKNDNKKGIDKLINWTSSFKEEYNFNNYVCQIDNADEEEYYFNSNGIGPLYNKISY